MPRIAAVLAVLAAVGFCIGFNTVRYPVVWEMLKQPGLLPVASTTPDGPGQPAAKVPATPQPAPKSAPPSPKPAAPAARGAKTAAAPKRDTTKAKPPDPQPEFCTADGVCNIAGSPQAAGKQGHASAGKPFAQGTDSPPDLPRDASLVGLTPSAPQPSPERPESLPQPSPAASGQLARVERPLVPVPDGPWPAQSSPLSPGGSRSDPGVGRPTRQSDAAVVPVRNPGVRPLPPVGDVAPPSTGLAEPNPVAGPAPVYPTTQFPTVNLSRRASGPSGKLVPVSGYGG